MRPIFKAQQAQQNQAQQTLSGVAGAMGVPGPAGPAGPMGPAGPAGGSASAFDRMNPLAWISVPGQNYASNDIVGLLGQTQNGCAAECAANASCVGAIFKPTSGQCWLKSSLGGPITDASLTLLVPPIPAGSKAAGMTVKLGKDHGGDDFVCYGPGTPVAACGAVCGADGNCTGYGGWPGGCCVKHAPTPVSLNDNAAVAIYT